MSHEIGDSRILSRGFGCSHVRVGFPGDPGEQLVKTVPVWNPE